MGIPETVFPQGSVRRTAILSTFVSVGNALQPFERLLTAVSRFTERLPKPIIIQHGNTPFDCPGCVCIPFMDMETFSRHVAESKVLILHAGAGSVIHAVRSGKIPIIMPRRMKYHEHVDDHQVAFAEVLAEKGFVIMIEEPDGLENAIEKALFLSRDQLARKTEPKLVALVTEILEQYDSECAHK